MYHLDQHVHFIGCEKSYVAGLALLLHARGYTVSGCSHQSTTHMIEKLRSRGCQIFSEGHHPTDADVIVSAPHTSRTHEEIKAARGAQRTVISYATLLAEVTRHDFTIATVGAHSTTMVTTMIGYLLHRARFSPMVLARGIMHDAKSSAVPGIGEWAVVDSKYALSELSPAIALISNLETLSDEDASLAISPLQPYYDLLGRLPFYGAAILCADDSTTMQIRRKWHGATITYGLNASAHVRGHIVDLTGRQSIFNVSDQQNHLLGTINLPLPGSDNVRHALGAIAVCHFVLGIPFEIIQKSLAKFGGVARHFQKIGMLNGAVVIDERAWHPKSVNNALLHARACEHKKLHVIFQLPNAPHAHAYWQKFIALFLKHDAHISTLHIVPIDKENESQKSRYDAEQLAADVSDATKNISLFCYQDIEEANDGARSVVSRSDLLLVIGPGTVAKLAQQLVSEQHDTGYAKKLSRPSKPSVNVSAPCE
jgi:UDP-N-acetylmuramate--alanine ligase